MSDLTLILNTAESYIQYAIMEESRLLCSNFFLANKGGVEILAPAIKFSFQRVKRSVNEIAYIACVSGPGNFTGLRIGLATSSALSRALGAKQAGLDYLQCLAANAPSRHGEKTLVLVKARSGFAFAGQFITDSEGVPQIEKPAHLVLVEKINQEAIGGYSFLVGSATELLPSSFACPPAPLNIVPAISSLIKCASLVDWDQADSTDIPPVYMRECDAVENIEHIALLQGMDPLLVQKELDRLVKRPCNL